MVSSFVFESQDIGSLGQGSVKRKSIYIYGDQRGITGLHDQGYVINLWKVTTAFIVFSFL